MILLFHSWAYNWKKISKNLSRINCYPVDKSQANSCNNPMKYILLSSIFSRWLRHREVKCPRSHYYMSDPGLEPRISGSRVCSLNYTKQYPRWPSYGVSPLWITQDQTLFPEGKKGKTVLYQLSVIATHSPTPVNNLHLQGVCLCSSL